MFATPGTNKKVSLVVKIENKEVVLVFTQIEDREVVS